MKSNKIITITSEHNELIIKQGVNKEKIYTIPNWSPLEEITYNKFKTDWLKENNIFTDFNIIYSGTLGLKHNPKVLLEIAIQNKDVGIIVISEGLGSDFLKEQKERNNIQNLYIFNFQPYNNISEILSSADILIALLENEASIYSVPSKILTYHCVGRPILLIAPKSNLASKTVINAVSGYVIENSDIGLINEKIKLLRENEILRNQLGANARNYAESNFDIKVIAEKFENIFWDQK